MNNAAGWDKVDEALAELSGMADLKQVAANLDRSENPTPIVPVIIQSVIRTERGWQAHGDETCKYHRNTLLALDDMRVVISSIGLTFDGPKNVGQVGYNRFYETLASYAEWNGLYFALDINRTVKFSSAWRMSKPSQNRKADEQHDAVVDELTQKMRDGTVCLARNRPLPDIPAPILDGVWPKGFAINRANLARLANIWQRVFD